jgi:membrane protein
MKNKLKYTIEFLNDDTLYFAASLSFFTIFSLIPILALLIVIMSTTPLFASQIDILMTTIYNFINPTHSEQIVSIVTSALVNIDNLGTIGIVYLLFVFIIFVKDYEHIVSTIHKTKKRLFINMLILYISFLIIIPFSFAIFTLVTSYLANNFFLDIFKFLVSILIITILFKISINKYVSLKASVIASVITVVILKITQVLFVYYIFYNTTYGTIYGTFSIVLFMFLWIYCFWIVYLYGVKIVYKLNSRNK